MKRKKVRMIASILAAVLTVSMSGCTVSVSFENKNKKTAETTETAEKKEETEKTEKKRGNEKSRTNSDSGTNGNSSTSESGTGSAAESVFNLLCSKL